MVCTASKDCHSITACKCLVECAAHCTAYSKGIRAPVGADADTATDAANTAPTQTSGEKRVDMLLHGPMKDANLVKATSETHQSSPVRLPMPAHCAIISVSHTRRGSSEEEIGAANTSTAASRVYRVTGPMNTGLPCKPNAAVHPQHTSSAEL